MRVPVLRAGMVVAACSLPLVVAASGQAPKPAAATARAQADETHFQISVMEGVLQRAAENGARQTSQRLMAVLSEPPLLWNGASRARGFRLENYGYFFDVEVPALRGSVAWSLQVLDRSQGEAEAQLVSALQALQQQIRTSVTDRQARDQMDQAVRRIQVQIVGEEASALSDPTRPPDPMRPRPVGALVPRPSKPPVDPNETYTTEVENALIDAMLDHGVPLRLGADEWLTIAARDNESNGVSAGQPYDLMTIILRIRGGDLATTQAALHGGRLSREEARKRVEVKEF